MYGMFYECTELSSLDLSSFNFGSDTIFTLMFDSLGVFAAIKPILVYVKNENDKNLLESKSTGINDKYAQIVVKQP
jgi:surface protein